MVVLFAIHSAIHLTLVRPFWLSVSVTLGYICIAEYNNIMGDDKKFKHCYYDGTGDVEKFVVRIELEAALKGHQDEKKAQFLASKLVGPAMEVYLRLSDGDRKEFDKIKAELYKEFRKGQLDREEAITVLGSRTRESGESAQSYAHKIIDLVKLAYPDFTDTVRASIAKDYFARGLRKEMRVALKSTAGYKDMDIKLCADEVVRLELAGVQPPASHVVHVVEEAGACSSEALVDAIAGRVLEKLKVSDREKQEVAAVNSRDDHHRDSQRSRGGRGSYRGNNRSRGRSQVRNSTRKCRSCGSSDHIIKDCPEKFCEACGKRGCKWWSRECPNLQ